MLITRAGESAVAAASSIGRRNFVRWKTALTLSARTRSKACSSYSAIGAPQVAPALLTRTSRWSSRRAISSARRRHSSSLERSAGIATHTPARESSAASVVARVGLARGDVDVGAGLDEAARDHLADAPAAAGHQHHLARYVKEPVHPGSVERLARGRGGQVRDAWAGELRPPLVGDGQGLVDVVRLDELLGQAARGVAPDHAEYDEPGRATASC